MPITSAEEAKRDVNSVDSLMGVSDLLGHIENVRTEDGRLITNINEAHYPDVRTTWSGTYIEYLGKNVTADASVSGTDWLITKFSYTSDEITRKQMATGAWSNRGGLF